MTGMVNVYVDGACVGHGSGSAQPGAGFGVWFGPNHELNFNCNVTDSSGSNGHSQTSQRAEIQAAQFAIGIAIREGILGLKIHTDSKYVLHGISRDGIVKWMENGWLNSRGKDIVNMGDWMNLNKKIVEYESHGGTLEWKYVKSHSGNVGNENADRLAKWAAVACYDFVQFLSASSKFSNKCCCCCCCPGSNATYSERQELARLKRKMLASRKKTTLQELMENRKIILP